MSIVTIPTSIVVVEDESIPSGLHRTRLEYFDSGEQASQSQTVAWINGRAEIEINRAAGAQTVGYVMENIFPPQNGACIAGVSTGQLECFANETFRTNEGYITNVDDIVLIEGEADKVGDNIELSNGAIVHVDGDGTLTFAPNNAFNYLNPGETATQSIRFTTALASAGPNLVDGTWDDSNPLSTYDDQSANAWTAQADNWWSVNTSEFPQSRQHFVTVTEGTEYTLVFEVRDSTLTSNRDGNMEVFALDNTGARIGSRLNEFSSVNGITERSIVFTVPTGMVGFEVDLANGTRADIRLSSLTAVIPAPESTIDITVKASEDVEIELITSPVVVSGTTVTPVALTGLMPNHVYQIAVEVDNLTTGSLSVALGSNTADHSIDGNYSDVFLLTANSANQSLNINLTPDFDGTIESVSVRKLVKKSGNAAPINAVLASSTVTGQLDIEWRVSPRSKFTDTLTPVETETGVLNFSDEFGVRRGSEITSMHVYDATSTAKRSAVSLKGGDWIQCENVYVTGGYPETSSSWKFQTGFIFCDTNEESMDNMQLINCNTDLLLPPMPDNYVTQNSDGLVNNNGIDAYFQRLYMVDVSVRNIADGGFDNKNTAFGTLCEVIGGRRCKRSHSDTHDVYAYSRFEEVEETECAFHFTDAKGKTSVFNSYHTGLSGTKRIVSNDQLLNLFDKNGRFNTTPAIATDDSGGGGTKGLMVLKTAPKIPDFAYVNATRYEFQISVDGGSNWSPLIVSYTNNHNLCGANKRTIDIAAGNYTVRCRSWYHDAVSAWTTSSEVTVS